MHNLHVLWCTCCGYVNEVRIASHFGETKTYADHAIKRHVEWESNIMINESV